MVIKSLNEKDERPATWGVGSGNECGKSMAIDARVSQSYRKFLERTNNRDWYCNYPYIKPISIKNQ
jgi:hypothetical protein